LRKIVSSGGSTVAPGSVACRGRGARSVGLIGLLVLCGSVLVAPSSALAAKPHTLKTTFGTFSSPSGITVDEANGNVFVADGGTNEAIEIFGPEGGAPSGVTGTRIGGFLFEGEATGLAIDESASPSSGDLYVTDARNVSGGINLGSIKKLRFNPATEEYVSAETLTFAEPFGEPLGVAVNGNGEVAVGSYSAAAVVISDAAGVETARIRIPRGTNPSAVAFDSAGDLYVQTYSEGEVWKFSANGAGVLESEAEAEEMIPHGATGLAVDRASDVLYVAMGDHVAEYNPSGELEGEFGSGTLSATERVAVGSGNIYVTQRGAANDVAVFDLEPSLSVRSGQATNITGETAIAEGSVDPAGTPLTACRFEYVTAAAYAATKFADLSSGGTVPCTPPAASITGSQPQAVSAELSGLERGHRYFFRLSAADAAGTVAGVARGFFTVGIPLAETTGSLVRTATSALLEGRVTVAHAPAVSYHFEYGTAGPCGLNPCTATAATAIGAPETFELVAQRVGGLAPNTTYHYRVVADNGSSAGPSFGQDMTVTTRASDEALSHGSFPGPPESDRAWEQVNAPDTGGAPISELKGIAPNGDSVIYDANGGTPESTIGGVNTPLFSERTENGWLARSFTPSAKEANGKNWDFIQPSSDLSRVVGTTHAGGSREYWEFSPYGPPHNLVSKGAADELTGFLAISRNGSRSVVAAKASLDPSHPTPPGIAELYAIDGGAPRLLSLLPNGEVPTCGVPIAGGRASFPLNVPVQNENWISPDGSVAYFPSEGTSCEGKKQLYARFIGAEETKRISPPAIAGEECSAYFIRSTPTAAYFWTRAMLTSEDQPSGECSGELSTNGDIYSYTLASGELECVTCLAAPGSPAEVEFATSTPSGSMAVSEDGSRIYFTSNARLVPGAANRGFYRLDPQTGNLHYIAPATAGYIGELAENGEAISGDGSVVVFQSGLGSLNPVNGMNNGATGQLYLYDDRTEALTCASCPQDGTPAGGSVRVSYGQGSLVTAETQAGANVTPISEDGLTFAFATPNALVPADHNTVGSGEGSGGGSDVYEWRDGRLLLVSDGTTDWSGVIGSSPKVGGVSASGADIYFTAAAQLTPDAPEASQRLYDARIGGGFQFPTTLPPCDLNSGACEGAGTSEPSQPGAGTAVFSGPGNPTPKSCPKGKRAEQRKGKVRCVKQRHPAKKHQKTKHKHKHPSPKHKQHTNHDRRSSR
jgi:streptogramin lyase